MKKLINRPRAVVAEMLEGLVDTSDHLALLEGENVVLQANLPEPAQRPVAVLSGGGSGHEPAHAGYVGDGMLTAAVAGEVFTSPSVDAILAAILASAGPRGALLVVKNYTGDRLNFALAAELAHKEGVPTEIVVVADDVSLEGTVPMERRRGIAGTVLVHKVAGAAARKGMDLAAVGAAARRVASHLATMGVGLSACTVPAAGSPGFELGDGEIEFGLGIHGEKGVHRGAIQPADAIVDQIIHSIRGDLARRGLTGKRVVLLVNGLGATPPMELMIVARQALARLRADGLEVMRAWVGNYMTALDMAGCSLTVLPVDGPTLELLDAPARASGWVSDGRIRARRAIVQRSQTHDSIPIEQPASSIASALEKALAEVAQALKAAEPQLTDLDSRAGDGDLGSSMLRAAEALLDLPQASHHTAQTLLLDASAALRRAIGGSSGPFYAVGLMRAARVLTGVASPTPEQWQAAFAEAVRAIGDMGGAKAGDRTMLDALLPAVEAWHGALAEGAGGKAAYEAAVSAAQAGARATAGMAPRLGRASYLGDRAKGVEDGGAVAVTLWMQAVARSLE